MATTRRQFIKRSATALSVGLMMPQVIFARRGAQADDSRRILVVIQLSGGNDGLNTFIPYTDSRYQALRPLVGFKENELIDNEGKSTILNGEFALHPALKEIKALFDSGKLAIVNGVGYGSANLSHSVATDVWHKATPEPGVRYGWLGRYADLTLQGKPEFSAVTVGSIFTPKVFSAQKITVPLIQGLGATAFAFHLPAESQQFSATFTSLYQREFSQGSFRDAVTQAARRAASSGGRVQEAVEQYRSSVTYPATNLAAALQTVAVLAAGVPESYIFHVSYPCFFDTHARQIGTEADGYRNRLIGTHASDLRQLSEAVKAFTDDMNEQGLGDNCLLMTYSEFGRRPNDNASSGTDHGTASNLFVVGNKVKGGEIYGLQPSLKTTDLDTDGNLRFTTDFRSVYATVIENWLGEIEAPQVLGGQFPLLGFL